MSPQIIREKLDKLFEYLKTLEKYNNISYQEYLTDTHFIIERLLELLVTTSTDILMHKMALVGESIPTTLRSVFLRAGELNWISKNLAEKLANSAGMRNLLVHGYEKIDHEIIYKCIKIALKDYTKFCESILKEL